MRIILFDTETNGLPKSWHASPYRTDNWPRILTLAWQMWEYNGGTDDPVQIGRGDYLITPAADIIWDEGAEKIHGITQDKATRDGRPAAEVLSEFVNIVRRADLIVAHNMAFDKTVLICEMIRLDPRLAMDWWPRFEYCTCEGTKTLCALPPPSGKPVRPSDPFKKPKLVELYRHLFPDRPADFPFHSAAGDTECLTQCFLELTRRRLVPLDLWARSLVRA